MEIRGFGADQLGEHLALGAPVLLLSSVDYARSPCVLPRHVIQYYFTSYDILLDRSKALKIRLANDRFGISSRERVVWSNCFDERLATSGHGLPMPIAAGGTQFAKADEAMTPRRQPGECYRPTMGFKLAGREARA